MSSEILTGDQSTAQPVPWRMVAAGERSAVSRRSEAEQQAVSRLDQARREAFAEGLAAGRQQVEEQVRPAIEGLSQALADLARLKDQMRNEATVDLVRLAVSIATRVIHREAVVDPDALSGLVKAAFAKVQSREISRVRIHPTLEGLVKKSLGQCKAPNNLVLVADPGLKPGEIFFETSQGTLDASVETQLREIERGLIDKLDRQ